MKHLKLFNTNHLIGTEIYSDPNSNLNLAHESVLATNRFSIIDMKAAVLMWTLTPDKTNKKDFVKLASHFPAAWTWKVTTTKTLYRAFSEFSNKLSDKKPFVLKDRIFSSWTSDSEYASDRVELEENGFVWKQRIKASDIIVSVSAALSGTKVVKELRDSKYIGIEWKDDLEEWVDAARMRKEFLVLDKNYSKVFLSDTDASY